MNFLQSIWARIVALGDKSGWILLVIGALAFAADPKMLASLVSWVAFAFIAAAVTIFVSRLGFSSIKFGELLALVKAEKNTAAAIVIASVVLYCGLIFVGVVLWAK